MKRSVITGLSLVTLFALGVPPTSAVFAQPGLLPITEGTGEGGEVVFETTNKEVLSCTNVKFLLFKFLPGNPIHIHLKPHFTGCKASHIAPFNTLGDAQEVALFPVLFGLCLVEPTKLVWGTFIQPIDEATGEPTTVHLEIPSLKKLVLLKGGVIAESEGAGLKGKAFKYKLEGKEGKQTVAKKCEIEGKTFEHTLEAGDDSGKDFPASETFHFTLEYSKEVELMDS